MQISDFVVSSDEYAHRLDETIYKSRDVNEGLKVANELMSENPSIMAIQVSSREDGLWLSTVNPAIEDFSRVPIAQSDYFDKPFTRVLYYRITKSMPLIDGFEVTFVSKALSSSEIRSRLVTLLIVVSGMFLITFVLILANPRTKSEHGGIEPRAEYEEGSDFDSQSDNGIESGVSPDYTIPEEDANGGYADEVIEDFAPADRLDENDLLVTKPEYGESVSMGSNDLPSLDVNETESDERTEMMSKLNKELGASAASNQDLSLIIISGDSSMDKFIREHYPNPNLVFPIDSGKTAVIEANKDLDSSISTAKEFLRECLSGNSNLKVFCGIAARNGRLISADVLNREAESSLLKADNESRIVGFRSDPEKYREFIRDRKSK